MIESSWLTCACTSGTTSTECDLGKVYEKIIVLLPTLDSDTVAVQGAMKTGGTPYNIYTYNHADGYVDQMITESSNGDFFCVFPIGGFQYITFEVQSSITGTFYVMGVRS